MADVSVVKEHLTRIASKRAATCTCAGERPASHQTHKDRHLLGRMLSLGFGLLERTKRLIMGNHMETQMSWKDNPVRKIMTQTLTISFDLGRLRADKGHA